MPGTQASSQPKAVLFDMDGLLVNTEPLWFEVEHEVMGRLGGTWTLRDQQALIGGSLHRTVDYLLSRATRPSSHAEVADWLVGGMADLLAERETVLMPGAFGLLAEVRAAGIPPILVTSSEQVIMDAVLTSLAKHDIAFTATVCGADVSEPKPHPEPYLLAASLVGADPAACVALEDSTNGVISALAAGCITIAVPSVAPVAPRPGLTIVGSLADVDLALLRDLGAQASVAPSPRGRPGRPTGRATRATGILRTIAYRIQVISRF